MNNAIASRYQVCCEVGCGYLSGHYNKADAFAAAQRAERQHQDCAKTPGIVIYDNMARRGAPDTWTSEGAVWSHRE